MIRSFFGGEKILGDLDSNQNKQNQNLLCYRYTIPQGIPVPIAIGSGGFRMALPLWTSRPRRNGAKNCCALRNKPTRSFSFTPSEFTLADAWGEVKPRQERQLAAKVCCKKYRGRRATDSEGWGSNPRPGDYESAALTAELPSVMDCDLHPIAVQDSDFIRSPLAIQPKSLTINFHPASQALAFSEIFQEASP